VKDEPKPRVETRNTSKRCAGGISQRGTITKTCIAGEGVEKMARNAKSFGKSIKRQTLRGNYKVGKGSCPGNRMMRAMKKKR
jgi:hypothetical protein